MKDIELLKESLTEAWLDAVEKAGTPSQAWWNLWTLPFWSQGVDSFNLLRDMHMGLLDELDDCDDEGVA